jgi:hypothetical protein
LPASISSLSSLEELSLQGNPGLAFLPDQLGSLPALRDLSAADCALVALPPSLATAPSLQSLSLYGNQLHQFPPALLQVGDQGLAAVRCRAVGRCWLAGWQSNRFGSSCTVRLPAVAYMLPSCSACCPI